ncbi:MAG: hypothetical protein ACYCZJ_09265 [Sulfuriferula sp.]
MTKFIIVPNVSLATDTTKHFLMIPGLMAQLAGEKGFSVSPVRFANSPYRSCMPRESAQRAFAKNRKSSPVSSYDSA